MAWKVYNNQEEVEKRQEKEQVTRDVRKTQLFATAIAKNSRSGNGRVRGRDHLSPRGTLEEDQCLYCKQKGHWKRECPPNLGQVGKNSQKDDPRVHDLHFDQNSD